MKMLSQKCLQKIITVCFFLMLISVAVFLYAEWKLSSFDDSKASNLFEMEDASFSGGFSVEGNKIIHRADSQTAEISIKLPLQDFSGFHVAFEIRSDIPVDEELIYVDLFNPEQEYDSDKQQFECRFTEGENHLGGNLITTRTLEWAHLRFVTFTKTKFVIKNIQISEIPLGGILLRMISKIIFAVGGLIALICIYCHNTAYGEVPNTISRNNTLDMMKGLGVWLVIMGHLQNPDEIGYGVWDYIYSFHMPMFFLISGYLFSDKGQSFRTFFIHKIKTIWLPYTVLYFVSLVYFAIITGAPENLTRVKAIMQGWLLSGQYLVEARTNNFPLWFLPHILLANCIFYFLSRNKDTKLFGLLLLIIAILTVPFQNLFQEEKCIWEIIVLPVSLVFMGLGYLYKKFENKIPIFEYDYVCFFWIGLLLTIGNPGASVMKIQTFLYFLGALLTVYTIYRVIKKCELSLLTFAGKHSLVAYGIHILVESFCFRLGIYSLFSGYTGMAYYFSKVFTIFMVDIIICKIFLVTKEYITNKLSN